jgi:hypothetical protein
MTTENSSCCSPSCNCRSPLPVLAGLLITAALGLFLLRQLYFVNAQVTQVKTAVREYQTIGDPKFRALAADLQTYARTHPDYAPIFAKYQPALGGIGVLAAPAAAAPKK